VSYQLLADLLASDVKAEAEAEGPKSSPILLEVEAEAPNMMLPLPLKLDITMWILVNYFAHLFSVSV
jgi:hypothetical protein